MKSAFCSKHPCEEIDNASNDLIMDARLVICTIDI